MIALWCHHSIMMAAFLTFVTQQPIIVIIKIIHSSCLVKFRVEHQEYISIRIAVTIPVTM